MLRVQTKPWLQSQEGDKARISQDDGVKEGGKKGGMRIKERKAARTRGSGRGVDASHCNDDVFRQMCQASYD